MQAERGAASAAEDAALLARMAAGDHRDAVGQLFDRYAGRVFGLGVQLLGDRGLAEELVQETFVRLWRQASRFDPERGTVATFLFTIARRLAVDLWRRPSSRPLDPEPERELAVSDDAFAALLDGLEVRDALESLSPPHREVLELAYQGGLRQAEIAARLGIPVGTVKTRTYHAVRALRHALEERGFDA